LRFMEKIVKEFKNFLNFLPPLVLGTEREAIKNSQDKEQIINFAKKAYPYVHGYLRIFNSCCRLKEEMGIHKFIKDEGIRARFDKFVHEGGDIEKIRQGKVEEDYLSVDDLAALKEAEREVHEDVHKETKAEIRGKRKAEFESYVKDGAEKLNKVEEKIAILRRLGDRSPEWRTEIIGKISELEERWASYNNEPTEQDVAELLEYYDSVANLGEEEN